MINMLESSRKSLSGWLWEELADLEFSSVYDPFCGPARTASFFKRRGYQVLTSDLLQSNYWMAKALVENNQEVLTPTHFNIMVTDSSKEAGFYFQPWADHYFTKDETLQLGCWWHNIHTHSTFQQNPILKSMALSAVYLTIAYWTNLNKGYLQPKSMRPQEVLRHYVQHLNAQVYDNKMPNVAYYRDAYDQAAELPADVALICPPGQQGFRNSSRRTELAECWTRRVAQINLENVIKAESEPKLGQTFSDPKDYKRALQRFLDACKGNRLWLVLHHERLGISLADLESQISQRRTIWKKASLEVPYPSADSTETSTETLIIAVAE
jgi:hypothetical protein